MILFNTLNVLSETWHSETTSNSNLNSEFDLICFDQLVVSSKYNNETLCS